MKSNNSVSRKSLTTDDTAWHYSRTAIVLHWTVALVLVAMAALGWFMMSIEDDPGSSWYFDLHKSFGLVFATLVAVRLVWRLSHRVQALPNNLPAWQVKLANWTQCLLYVLMVLMPVTGYLGASYSKKGVKFFGINMPHWAMPNHDLAEQFYGIHSLLIWVLTALVVLHVAGGLKHLLVDKDTIFQRMWFSPSSDRNNPAKLER